MAFVPKWAPSATAIATNAIHPKMASFGFAAAHAPILPARLLSFIGLPRLPLAESRTVGWADGTVFRGVLGEAATPTRTSTLAPQTAFSGGVTEMETRELGRTGVHVSALCLGAMMFGAWGNTDHDESIRVIHRALDAGVNFIDTADVYARGESEEIVG